jgi:hypothetical protein
MEYFLDDALEKGLTVREQHSSAIINTTLGKPLPAAIIMTEEVTPALTKAPSKHVAVETDEKGIIIDPSITVHFEQSQPIDPDISKYATPLKRPVTVRKC